MLLMGQVVAGRTWHHNDAWRHVESDAEQEPRMGVSRLAPR